jgi:SAM-dependent methyltransferase
MYTIESFVDEAGAPYDSRAAIYDRLVRSRAYNRIAWSTAPAEYAAFAAAAIGSSRGPLLEAAVGSAAATAQLHADSGRPTVLVDLSRPMLDRAAQRIAAAAGDGGELPDRIRLVQADILALPFTPHGFGTVLGLGLAHLFADLPALVAALRAQLMPGGRLHLAGLVAQTRRARRYLQVLHRAGEVAAPRTADELRRALGDPADFHTRGCMAYATLAAG